MLGERLDQVRDRRRFGVGLRMIRRLSRRQRDRLTAKMRLGVGVCCASALGLGLGLGIG